MDSYEFKEDNLTEAPFRNFNSDGDCRHSVHVSRLGICSKKNDVGLLGRAVYADTECSFDDTSKLDTFEIVDFDKDKSLRLASDDDVSMSGRFLSAVADNDASCDRRPSDDCETEFHLGGEEEEVTFDPDYVYYCGAHYMDSKVSFFRGYVEVWCRNVNGNGETFHVLLEIEDIVKIESQWSAHFKVGIINISFISKDAVENDGHRNSSASGIHELVFPTFETNWDEKLEAIESLDDKYRALWNVILHTGIEQSSTLPEQSATILKRSYFPSFDVPFEEVIYPKGDPDAVSISKRDVELLLPDTFVNDTIIDFYIKYLKTKQNSEEKTKFHFFNSFFFRKLADMDKDPSSVFDGKAAFQRVRKWTRKVKLEDKDFIFIPVNYNYHWSLIVICYFADVVNYTDSESKTSTRVPCILHMDSLRGTHVGLKDLFQSYLLEEWKERNDGLCDDLISKFRSLKFVSLELPQQQNTFDCGLFLLHYVELFLDGVFPNFTIYNVTACSKFLQPDWFPPEEASMKRTHIERLISDLIDIQSDNCSPAEVSRKEHCPEKLRTSHVYENDAKDPKNSECLRNERRVHVASQGIEMTLLPGSSTSNQCTRTSELVLSELLQPAISPHAFDASSTGAFENRSSLDEFQKPPILTEDDAECLISTDITEPVLEKLVHKSSSSAAESSPVTQEPRNAVETNSHNETADQSGNPLFLKNPTKFCDSEADTASFFSYSDQQNASKRRHITQLSENGEDLVDEQLEYSPKRMRMTTLNRNEEEDLDLSCPNHFP